MLETVTLFFGATVVGLASGMLGLGGGVFIIPLLTLGFGMSIKSAVALSLVCVIPTSMAASNVYLKSGVIDVDLAVTLSLYTTIGGIIGGVIAGQIDPAILEIIFAVVLLYSAISVVTRTDNPGAQKKTLSHRHTKALHAIAVVAGVLTGIVGLGGGVVLIPLMYIGFGLPIAQAIGSSALIVGVTGTAAATVHVLNGALDPVIQAAPPIVVGMILGAHLGGRLGVRVKSIVLRVGFALILLYSCYRMAIEGLRGLKQL